MIVKLMSGENLPDTDPRKAFSIYCGVQTISFDRLAHEGCTCHLGFNWFSRAALETGSDSRIGDLNLPVFGMVYVMNDEGKTVERFDPS